MIELSKEEQEQLMALAQQMEAVTGRSGAYFAILEAIERMTINALRIPAELLREPEPRAGERSYFLARKGRR